MKKKFTLSMAAMLFASGGLFAQSQPHYPINAVPIVIEGKDLGSTLLSTRLNADAQDVVGFKYDYGIPGWVQVRIQVDERAVKYYRPEGTPDANTLKTLDGARIYNYYKDKPTELTGFPTSFQFLNDQAFHTTGTNHAPQYCDPDTWMGADYDTKFDDDDELVFMARELGLAAPNTAPIPGEGSGTHDAQFTGKIVSNTGVRVRVQDPLSLAYGYLYLFRRNAAASSPLVQGTSAAPLVEYTFKLDADPSTTTYQSHSNYKKYYNIDFGPNFEHSKIVADYYTIGFSDRWIQDELIIKPVGGGVAKDILQGAHTGQAYKDPSTHGLGIGRSVFTASHGQFDKDELCYNQLRGAGAFVANISGAVRAIRSFLGANSGAFTQKECFYYDRMEVIRTTLRVHIMPGFISLYNYASDAGNMTYYNNNNTGGLAVNGVDGGSTATDDDFVRLNPSTGVPEPVTWEFMSTNYGKIYRHNFFTHDFGTGTTNGSPANTNEPNIIRDSYYADRPNYPALNDASDPQIKRPGDPADQTTAWGAVGNVIYGGNSSAIYKSGYSAPDNNVDHMVLPPYWVGCTDGREKSRPTPSPNQIHWLPGEVNPSTVLHRNAVATQMNVYFKTDHSISVNDIISPASNDKKWRPYMESMGTTIPSFTQFPTP